MKKLVLLAVLLMPVAAGAQATKESNIVIHNVSTTSDLVGFSIENHGLSTGNWLAGEEWPEVNAIEPGASASFTHTCSYVASVYITDIISVQTIWRDRETFEHTDLTEEFIPCDFPELYLTPEGRVIR